MTALHSTASSVVLPCENLCEYFTAMIEKVVVTRGQISDSITKLSKINS